MTPTRRRILRFGTAASVALLSSIATADTITLRNGTVLNGIVRQIDGGYDVTLPDGKHRFVPSEEAKSIKIDNTGKVTEGSARERLASLQRSVENERDIARIIDRYQQFITMNAGTEAAKLAQTDLDEWQKRQAENRVRVGRRWLTQPERDQALLAAAKSVGEVNALISADRLDEAAAALHTLLEEDPDNISYQYLTGVLQLRREQFFEAKRSFDAVAERISDHAPTTINLAVLAAQFKRWPQAVSLLDQALVLAPNSQEVLDNIFEFQQLAPESVQRTGSYEKLMKRAAPLEAALEERQAKRGLFRLGSSWVDRAALERFNADRAAFEKKKADMDKDYQDTQDAVRKTDEQIQLVQRMIVRIESDSVVRATDGTIIRRQYPPTYWELQRDLATLQTQRQDAVRHIADLKREAEKVKAAEPKPAFAGKLSPIDHRGVPVILPLSATSQPTTQPQPVEPEPAMEPATQPATSQPATNESGPTTRAANERGLFE